MRGHQELAAGIHQLSVQPGINCWVLVDDGGATLVDTGLDRPGLLERLAHLGIAPSDVGRVVLTHGHPDHAGGLRAIATPGHTPGHLAYHLPAHGVLLGGDVVFNLFRVRPAPPFLCWRVPVNRRSVLRLAEESPGTLALAHGRPVVGDVAGRLRQFVADRRR